MKAKSNPILDLAADIQKSRAALSQSRPAARAPAMAPAAPSYKSDLLYGGGTFVKSMGPGGVVFDFGFYTGNPAADYATEVLNQFVDPVQEQIARDQKRAMAKSLVELSTMGEYAYNQKIGEDQHRGGNAMHQGWDAQLNKSLDAQVVAMVQKDGLGAVPGEGIRGDFNKSTMVVGGEQIVGQSETDAAVIEMMKSMGTDLSDAPEG